VAVIATERVADTAEVDAVNVADEDPAATVTEAGVVTTILLSDRLMTAPPKGAAPDSVTEQVLELPPITVAGKH
jgi:hypothetical protein